MTDTDLQPHTGVSPIPYDPQKPVQILRLPEVITRVGLKRASIYLHMTQGTFPKPISLGARAVGWLDHEIDAWLRARIEARRVTQK